VAKQFGVKVEPKIINDHFSIIFKDQSTKLPNFGITANISSRQWWREVVYTSFVNSSISKIELESKFDKIFNEIYDGFSRSEFWETFPDVHSTLTELKKQNIKLGIISNFDERLHNIIVGLKLNHFFDFTLLSREFGVPKPDQKIFLHALKLGGIQNPGEVFHIGDNLEKDYRGAKTVGIRALLLDRTKTQKDSSIETIFNLHDVLQKIK